MYSGASVNAYGVPALRLMDQIIVVVGERPRVATAGPRLSRDGRTLHGFDFAAIQIIIGASSIKHVGTTMGPWGRHESAVSKVQTVQSSGY